MRVHLCVYMGVFECKYVCMHMYVVYVYACLHVCVMYVCICVHVCVCVCMCVYVCMYWYIHVHTSLCAQVLVRLLITSAYVNNMFGSLDIYLFIISNCGVL